MKRGVLKRYSDLLRIRHMDQRFYEFRGYWRWSNFTAFSKLTWWTYGPRRTGTRLWTISYGPQVMDFPSNLPFCWQFMLLGIQTLKCDFVAKLIENEYLISLIGKNYFLIENVWRHWTLHVSCFNLSPVRQAISFEVIFKFGSTTDRTLLWYSTVATMVQTLRLYRMVFYYYILSLYASQNNNGSYSKLLTQQI